MTLENASPTVTRGASGNADNGLARQPHSITARPNRQASNYLAFALRYALNGWRVLPLQPGGKAPAIPAAHPEGDPLRGKCKGECGRPGHGVHDASSDPETIGGWWQRWPAANIGLALGDDLVAFDVDPRHGGTLDALLKLGLDPSETVTQRTAGGGWHVLYAKPHGWQLVGAIPHVPGIDVLAAGRYIVASPSTVNGKPYRWERDPLDVDPARIPLELAERLAKRSPAARTDAQDGAQAHRTAQPGEYGLDDLKAMLAVLDPWQGGYSDFWVPILMACHAGFGDEALPIVEGWADGKLGEVSDKWKSFDAAGGVTVATLVYHARAAGWVPPAAADEIDLPAAWRITPDDWKACPTCAALHTDRYSDNSLVHHHNFCRRPTCPVYRKVKARDALRPVFGWRGVQTETVPAADWRRWRKTANLRYGDNWRAVPLPDGARLAVFEVEAGGLELDDVLNVAVAAILENEAARRARRQALAFLNTLPENEALDPVTLERMKEALDLLASKPTAGNVSTPRRKRTDGPALAVAVKPAKPHKVATLLVSKPWHRQAMLAVLNRLQIPWERRSYGGWRTDPLTDVQMIQVTAALACAVPGARVLCGALEAGSYAELSTAWPEDLPHSEREAALYALRNRVNLEQTQPLRR